MGKRFLVYTLAFVALGCSSQTHSRTANELRAEALLKEGIDALGRKSYSEALRALLEAHRFDPKSADILTDLGIAYAGKEEGAKAEDAWRRALVSDPKHQDARLNLGIFYMGKKRWPEAERVLREAQKDITYHGVDLVAYQLGQLYLVQNKPLLAEQQFKIATRENATNCLAWEHLAKLQEEKGDYAEATKALRGATTGSCFKSPAAHYEMATLLLKQQQLPEARAKLLEIIKMFPTSQWASRSEATLNMIR